MAERRGLLSRVKNRLSRLTGGGKASAGIGPGFPQAYTEEWNELVEQVDNFTQKIGAAVVQTWEVGAAEVGRAVHGHAQDKVLIERFSDALVPTLSPFQDLHKQCSGAMSRGLARGVEGNSMAAAVEPLIRMVDGLGDRSAEGWGKTATYLDPLFELTADPIGARARFLEGGTELSRACVSAQAVLRQRLEAIPGQPKLWDGVCDSWDAWQLALVRDIEISITKSARGLVADVRTGLGK